MSGISQLREGKAQRTGLMRWIFTSSAMLTIIALAMLIFLFFRESFSFFPEYQKSLQDDRTSGMEYVDLLEERYRALITIDHELIELRAWWIEFLGSQALAPEVIQERLHRGPAARLFGEYRAAARPLRRFIDEKLQVAIRAREQLTLGHNEDSPVLLEAHRELTGELAAYGQLQREFNQRTEQLFAKAQATELAPERLRAQIEELAAKNAAFHAGLEAHLAELKAWNPKRELAKNNALTAFFTGTKWITASEQKNRYGLLPLLSGSLLVAGIALVLAVPLGVGAAVYVNQLAGHWEQAILKPSIEFISALPAVVVGFFGVMVFGEFVQLIARSEALQWLSFLQVQERLNAFTAGSLLALMAIPTIFTLTEDALYAVRKEIKEASFAIGATRLQTAFRIVIPSALPGIISAVLLGFGRVVGETMIVLLCAGNRVKIPEWSEGLAVIFDPVHTMTGMIAQEMGEVVYGNLHYRALFMVGFVLFIISMVVNYVAQALVQRHRQTQEKYQR